MVENFSGSTYALNMENNFEARKQQCDISSFSALDIRVGTILEAELSPRARVPAYRLRIDFGPLGVLTSSARITELYGADDLPGRQVVAVVNFPPRQVASVLSECLVLGALDGERGVVLLQPDSAVPDGIPVA
jgi:tRNA-binding protein